MGGKWIEFFFLNVNDGSDGVVEECCFYVEKYKIVLDNCRERSELVDR